MARRIAPWLLVALLATPALADLVPSDGIAFSGHLSDRDLHRLVTCGALPGGDCRSPELHWPERPLTIRVAPAKGSTPPGFRTRLMAATRHAIAEVNGVGAGITLVLTDAAQADVTVRPTDIPDGTLLPDEPGFSGPGVMGVGYMTVWSDPKNQIIEGSILISTAITDDDLTSVVLEEVTQSLGLLYDIESPAYEGVSILAQGSNLTTRLEGQDAAILRLHYPPKD